MSKTIKKVFKRIVKYLLPDYRAKNIYDPAANRGTLRIYLCPGWSAVVIATPLGILIIYAGIPASLYCYSWSYLKKLIACDLSVPVNSLHPNVLLMFLRAKKDALSKSTRLPLLEEFELAINISQITPTSPCAIFLGEDFGGYFHFLMEILPILLLIRDKFDLKVFVQSSILPKFPFVISAFSFFGLTFQILEPWAIDCSLKKLVKLKSILQTSSIPYYYPNIASVVKLRQSFIASYSFTVDHSVESMTRILLLRSAKSSAGRLLENADELEIALNNYGFQVLYAEELPFNRQCSVFHSAEVVVSVHGAGLSNIVFMKPGSLVIELVPSTEVKWHFALIAKICHLNYKSATVETITANESNLRPMVVNADIPRIVDIISSELCQ